MLLTKGVVLPERALRRIHLTVIADAIRAAWRFILAEWPDQAAVGDERLVNAALVARLKIASTIPSPFTTLVSRIDRGTEDYSFDGTHIEKRPDINMLLTERLAGFPFCGGMQDRRRADPPHCREIRCGRNAALRQRRLRLV